METWHRCCAGRHETRRSVVARHCRSLRRDRRSLDGRGQAAGYAGNVDLEIVGGRRARDVFGGVTSSAAVGEVEVHGELALFRTPAGSLLADANGPRTVAKAVVGGSYQFGVGAGLLVYAEYHYSGFGSASADGFVSQFQNPAFQERYLRGDTQILGRHVTAVLASYELSPEVALSTEWLQSPIDGSGIVVPSTTLTFGDRWSLLISGYMPVRASARGHDSRQRVWRKPAGRVCATARVPIGVNPW